MSTATELLAFMNKKGKNIHNDHDLYMLSAIRAYDSALFLPSTRGLKTYSSSSAICSFIE